MDDHLHEKKLSPPPDAGRPRRGLPVMLMSVEDLLPHRKEQEVGFSGLSWQ